MSKSLFVLLIIGVLVGSVVLFWNRSQIKEPQTKLAIGLMLPLSGKEGETALDIKRAIELAHKETTLEDVEITIVPVDTKCDPDEAVKGINTLINNYSVVAIIGDACSGGTIASLPIATEHKIVMISPSSTSPKLSGMSEYFFRTVPNDSYQGAFGAELAYKKNIKKLAILYSNDVYGTDFKNVLTTNFEKLGGKVVASEKFERTTSSVTSQLARIKKVAPDAIYLISSYQEASIIVLKDIKKMNINAIVIGSESLKNQYILQYTKEYSEGMIVTSLPAGSNSFLEKFKLTYGVLPNTYAAQAYDAFIAIATAIEQGATNGEEIKNKLRTINFLGVSGDITFDDNGDLQKGTYEIYEVKDGQFILQ